MRTHRICAAALTVLALLAVSRMTGAQSDSDETCTMYVKVLSSNPDAVIMSSTDFFDGEHVGTLIQNQPVEMFTKIVDGEYVKIRARIDGKAVTGWVKKAILQEGPLTNVVRVTERGSVDNARWGPSPRISIEDGMRKDSPQMKKALERIDALEEFLAKHNGVKKEDDDSGVALMRFRNFAVDGGLRPGSSK